MLIAVFYDKEKTLYKVSYQFVRKMHCRVGLGRDKDNLNWIDVIPYV